MKTVNNHAMKNRNNGNLNTKSKQDSQQNTITSSDAWTPFVHAMMKSILDDGARDIVIVCFGTMSITGDAFGPLVGTMLTTKYNIPAFVYGTQDNTVNGKNMKEWLDFIKTVHEGALFIAVDASLGSESKIGQIVLREDGVCPAGVKGQNARFGDIGILGVVAQNSTDPLMQLMTVSQVNIEKMADKVSNMIYNAIA